MRIMIFCLAIFLTKATLASLQDLNFSELLSSPATYHVTDISKAQADLWQKYIETAQSDAVRKAQHEKRELVYGDKTMRFSLDKKGQKGATGFPVYIALHGGGGAPASLNDSQWQHMKIYYKDSVKDGIYVAPRGVSNTWNLHFMDESYPLYDRLIENLIAYEGADPNRVYLLGFSAGGDGVYQIVPRMPDRFAAANMSAGHHNSIRFDNLLNTPFLLQVGEYDSAYNRNRVAAENYLALQNLRKQHQGYVSDLFIHTNAGHNGWYDNDARAQAHPIIKDPKAWLENGDKTQDQKNTNAVLWLNHFARSPMPKKLIWDLSTRSIRSKTWGATYVADATGIKDTRDLFYWLALEDGSDGRIEAQITEDNAVEILDATKVSKFKILLSNEMFDFSRPVKVYYQGRKIAEVSPKAKVSVMARTLLERGDEALMFHDEIEVKIPLVGTLQADKFSYCSNGRCTLMSASDFAKVREFPLDLNYTCKKNNQYALTFDDGPTGNYPAVLEKLSQHKVKATFFVNGMNMVSEQGKEWVKNASLAGHEIANHTYYHRSLVELSKEEIRKELDDTKSAILNTIGDNSASRRASSIVRPPFGNIDARVQEVMKELGLVSVRWNSDRYDWQITDSFMIKDRVRQHLDFMALAPKGTNRSIIDLNHDGSGATLSALDEIIPMIKNAGYEMVSLSECLGLES
jgi:peptidoglycan/xylan/chitin deacetylase (PgdA/CDA1 family)/predicted esterase